MAKATAKFDELLRRARAADFKRVVVPKRSGADQVFYGALVAEVYRDVPIKKEESFFLRKDEWTGLRLYVLRSGRFAVIKEEADLLQLRLHYKADILEGIDSVVESCGQTELAKALYSEAGIDAAEELDAPQDGGPQVPDTLQRPSTQAADAGAPAGSAFIDRRPRAPLCDSAELGRRIEEARSSSARDSAAIKSILEGLKERGLERPLAQAEPRMLDRLIELAVRFPNLAEVLAFVRRRVRLALRTRRRVLRLPPVLLAGAPGTGKTRALEELAGAFGVDFLVVDCGVLTANFVIAGADQTWNGGKPGRVFEALGGGTTLNPVVLLDEIDKLSGERRYDPYGPLHTLLEPRSARRFTDEYIKLPVDASHMLWFATANQVEAIPAPIRSRLRRFDVLPPTKAEMAAVVKSVYADLIADEDLDELFAPELPAETVSALSVMTPRAVRAALDDAMARASEVDTADGAGRLVVLPAQVEAAVSRKSERRPIGFAAS